MCPNCLYFGPNAPVREYFKAKVYTIWAHGALGKYLRFLIRGSGGRGKKLFIFTQL